MYNLEENYPLEIRGCSAFAVKYQNRVYYGRNNDLPPCLKKDSKSEIYRPDNGYAFCITTSSFINGEEGINEKGLSVAMTFVLTDLKDIQPGFNSVFVVRYLLEKAADVNEAIELLNRIPVASNMNILLADKSGTMIVVECSTKEKNIRKSIILNNGIEIICTVNQFTSSKMRKYKYISDTYQAKTRYDTIINAFFNYQGEDIIEYIKNI